MADRPNVLLVVLDSVRAKNTSLHGHRNETTPFLDRFSERATHYTQARSPSINTISSHTSIFTGYHTAQHGVERNAGSICAGSTIWETLREEYDYATGLFTPNVVLTESSNLATAFEFVESLNETGNYERPNKLFGDAFGPTDIATAEGIRGNIDRSIRSDSPGKALLNCLWQFGVELEEHLRGANNSYNIPAQEYVDPFFTWVDSSGGPWASCLNFMDAHQPYLPLEQYDRWGSESLRELYTEWMAPKDVLSHQPWWKLEALAALYDGGIYQADQAVEAIIERLRARGELEETLVVITSDHGEGFGERSFVEPSVRAVTHSWSLNECLTHVPLLVKSPGQTDGRTVSEVVSLVEFPTVVTDTIHADGAGEPFVSDDPVLASTSKLFEDQLERVVGADEAYVGPWRAVYRTEDGVVNKYIDHHGSSATVTVVDARTAYKSAETDTGIVDAEFSRLDEPAGIKTDDEELSGDVTNRLEELGYIQ